MYKNTFGPKLNCPLVSGFKLPKSYRSADLMVIGGPCSIESESQVEAIFDSIKKHVTYFRGGVFRAGTFPGDQWGWQMDLLKMYHSAAKARGKPNIVDVLDFRDLEKIDPYTDVFQVGTRQSQHYALLKELGRQSKPVILKRGTWQKLSEFLGSAEYILKEGNPNVILCERGGVSCLDHVRWELSISMIALIKQMTELPIIVDASHGTGNRNLVKSMTLAGVAAGADGMLIETHCDPDASLSDSEQAVDPATFIDIVETANWIRDMI